MSYEAATGSAMPIVDRRTVIRDRYGEALASKASDEFCLVFGRESQQPFAAFEGPAEYPHAAAIVVEFTPPPELVSGIQAVTERLRQRKAWTGLKKAIDKVQVGELDITLHAAQLLRQSRVMSARYDFYKTAGAICDEIERSARGFFRPGPEATASPQTPSAVTEVCWLNRSIRTWVDPRLLAEVAADSKVSRIDLPHRLEPEVQQSSDTVGAVEYRERSSHTGKGVIIAVIDSEVALRHPAFQDRIIHKQNYSLELWGNPGAHGTAVAGVAAANGDGLIGMAPDATIYNYKVLATNRFLNADDFSGALAIERALEDGAHIANCSWGAGPAGDGTSREARACDFAWALGLTIVKSAGNRGPGTVTLTTPADADGVIVVGATDQLGMEVQDYSSRGPTLGGKLRPHLVAPGGLDKIKGINSCLVEGGFGDCGHGTSYAAAHVTGLIALILEGQPDLTPDEQRDLLLDCCTPFDINDENTHGRGLLSLAKLR